MLNIIGRILRISGKYRGRLILSFVMSFLESTMASSSLFAVYLALKWITEGTIDTARIAYLFLFLSGAALLRYLFKLLEYIFQSGVGYEMISDKRLRLGEKLLHLSMGFYSDTDAGNISSVLNADLVLLKIHRSISFQK